MGLADIEPAGVVCAGEAGHIPQAHRMVPAAAGQGLAVRTEGYAQDAIGMAHQRRETPSELRALPHYFGGETLATSHRRIVKSAQALANIRPSGLKATDQMTLV